MSIPDHATYVAEIRRAFIHAKIHNTLDTNVTVFNCELAPGDALKVAKGVATLLDVSTAAPDESEINELEQNPYFEWLAKEMGYDDIRSIVDKISW